MDAVESRDRPASRRSAGRIYSVTGSRYLADLLEIMGTYIGSGLGGGFVGLGSGSCPKMVFAINDRVTWV